MRMPGLTQLQDDIDRAINRTDGTASLNGHIERGAVEVV
jgi:hypothetical protein